MVHNDLRYPAVYTMTLPMDCNRMFAITTEIVCTMLATFLGLGFLAKEINASHLLTIPIFVLTGYPVMLRVMLISQQLFTKRMVVLKM